MNNVMVLGSSGFIGSHVVSQLVAIGKRVTGIDIHPPVGHSALRQDGPSSFFTLDLRESSLDEILLESKPDVIVNAAGAASVLDSMKDPWSDFHSSVTVMYRLADSLRRTGVESRLLFLSSAAVYGNPDATPISEEAPIRPISPYGYHKLMCENILHEFGELYGQEAAILRIFSTYGPGLRRQVVWDICQKALHQDEVVLYGSGAETRDFIHVDDIVGTILLLAERAAFHGEAYNIASGNPISIRDLAIRVVHALGLSGKPIRFSGNDRTGDPKRWCADITRLSLLGFKASVDLDKGLSDYASWVRNRP